MKSGRFNSSHNKSGGDTQVKIAFVDGGNKGEKYRLNDGIINLGRSSNNDIIINDNKCSREHATIFVQSQTAFLVNNKPNNPILVNKHEVVGKIELLPGDNIELGSTTVLVYDDHETAPLLTKSPTRKKSISSLHSTMDTEETATIDEQIAARLKSDNIIDPIKKVVLKPESSYSNPDCY